MRREHFLGSLIAAALLPACSAPPRYDATAATLLRPEQPTASYGLSKAWKPLGKNFSYTLSDEENARAQFFLASCVSELTARFSPAPGLPLQAVQISECMRARGWHLTLEEITPTR